MFKILGDLPTKFSAIIDHLRNKYIAAKRTMRPRSHEESGSDPGNIYFILASYSQVIPSSQPPFISPSSSVCIVFKEVVEVDFYLHSIPTPATYYGPQAYTRPICPLIVQSELRDMGLL